MINYVIVKKISLFTHGKYKIFYILQLFKAFSKATEKLPKSKTSLKESDILDVVESVCTGEKTFES